MAQRGVEEFLAEAVPDQSFRLGWKRAIQPIQLLKCFNGWQTKLKCYTR
jgi:hypothetical protein